MHQSFLPPFVENSTINFNRGGVEVLCLTCLLALQHVIQLVSVISIHQYAKRYGNPTFVQKAMRWQW